MSEEKILFDIHNLFARCVENKLNCLSDLKNKIEYLISLVDFYTSLNFSQAEKEEINNYYTDATAERYEAPYIAADEAELIINYTIIINSIEKGIDLINQVCDENQKDKALSKALEVIDIVEKNNNRKIINNLVFENTDKPIKNKKSLKTLLQEANAKKETN